MTYIPIMGGLRVEGEGARGPLFCFEGNHLPRGIVQSPQGCTCVVGMKRGCTLTKNFFGPLFLNFLDPPPTILGYAKYFNQ